MLGTLYACVLTCKFELGEERERNDDDGSCVDGVHKQREKEQTARRSRVKCCSVYSERTHAHMHTRDDSKRHTHTHTYSAESSYSNRQIEAKRRHAYSHRKSWRLQECDDNKTDSLPLRK